ncbi:hypothetical protein [Lysobacter gummosus]
MEQVANADLAFQESAGADYHQRCGYDQPGNERIYRATARRFLFAGQLG